MIGHVSREREEENTLTAQEFRMQAPILEGAGMPC